MGDKLETITIKLWQKYFYADDEGQIFLKSDPTSPLKQYDTGYTLSGHRRKKYKTIYLGGKINKRFLAHRVLWVLWYGEYPNIIDHINNDTQDNRKSNLRNVDAKGNSANRAEPTRLKPNNPMLPQYISKVKRAYLKRDQETFEANHNKVIWPKKQKNIPQYLSPVKRSFVSMPFVNSKSSVFNLKSKP